MDRIIKNYKEPEFKRMSGKQYLRYLKHKREVNKQNKKSEKHYKKFHPQRPLEGHVHDHPTNSHTPNIIGDSSDVKLITLALVVDNVVVDILRSQENFAKNFLKEHIFIEIDPKKHLNNPQIGFFYKDEEFLSIDEYNRKTKPTSRG